MMVVRHKRIEIAKGIIGVISDTHGLVRPEALAALKGVELIVHGGDIGKPEVLESLGSIAPVHAIRGNNDRDPWAQKLPDILDLRVNRARFYVIHNVNELAIDPNNAGIRVVVSGHSHKPSVAQRDNVMFLNPGSAGPRRFKLPVTLALVKYSLGDWSVKMVNLLEPK